MIIYVEMQHMSGTNEMNYSCAVDSPVGKLTVTSDGEYITGVVFGDGETASADYSAPFQNRRTSANSTPPPHNGIVSDCLDERPLPAVIYQCVRELEDYFAGTLCDFTVPIKPSGTAFRLRVWEELRRIPYGETVSYRQLAARTGNPKAVRAVGGANHHNPIVIIIPCHRVIGSDGSLTGFGGGLENKARLLDLERRTVTNARRTEI